MTRRIVWVGGVIDHYFQGHPRQTVVGRLGHRDIDLADGPTAPERSAPFVRDIDRTWMGERLLSEGARSLYLLLGEDLTIRPVEEAEDMQRGRILPIAADDAERMEDLVASYAKRLSHPTATIYVHDSEGTRYHSERELGIFAHHPDLEMSHANSMLTLDMTRMDAHDRLAEMNVFAVAADRAREFLAAGRIRFTHPSTQDGLGIGLHLYNGSGVANEAYPRVKTRVRPVPEEHRSLFDFAD